MTSQAFFNQRAGFWDEKMAEKNTAKLEAMTTRLGLAPGITVLDVGTGTGILLPFLAKAVGDSGRIFALDFAQLMLKRAKNKKCAENVAYILADISHIPAEPNSFDAVVCYSSFPHFPDKPAVLAEIYRTIRPGGRLSICHTSSRGQINGRHQAMNAVKDDLLPDEEEMKLMLSAAGFTGIRIDDRNDGYLAVAEKSHL